MLLLSLCSTALCTRHRALVAEYQRNKVQGCQPQPTMLRTALLEDCIRMACIATTWRCSFSSLTSASLRLRLASGSGERATKGTGTNAGGEVEWEGRSTKCAWQKGWVCCSFRFLPCVTPALTCSETKHESTPTPSFRLSYPGQPDTANNRGGFPISWACLAYAHPRTSTRRHAARRRRPCLPQGQICTMEHPHTSVRVSYLAICDRCCSKTRMFMCRHQWSRMGSVSAGVGAAERRKSGWLEGPTGVLVDQSQFNSLGLFSHR